MVGGRRLQGDRQHIGRQAAGRPQIDADLVNRLQVDRDRVGGGMGLGTAKMLGGAVGARWWSQRNPGTG
jgi:hypothetical protein